MGIVRFLRSKGISLEHWQIIAIFLVLCDAVAISAAYLGALFLRFDGVFSQIPQHFLRGTLRVILPYIMLCVVCFWKGKMYQDMWRFASFSVLSRTLVLSFATSAVHAAGITLLYGRYPLSYYLLGALFQFLFLLAPRFSYRMLQYLRSIHKIHNPGAGRVILIGAVSAGQMILRDLNSAKEIRRISAIWSPPLSQRITRKRKTPPSKKIRPIIV
ncbi:MAG: hypothetical protein IJ246_01320 [Clostridia bacterium]|nr:hypothetical protein [Clostridia bacterium]